jgi:hypothetical protein
LIFPFPEVLRLRANALAHIKLLVTHLVSSEVLDRFNQRISPADVANGSLEQARLQGNSLIASGWAWRRSDAGTQPDCILIGLRLPNGRLQPLSVAPLRGARQGIEEHYHRSTAKALAFYCSFPIVKPITGSVEAWAADSVTERVWPLGGAVAVATR